MNRWQCADYAHYFLLLYEICGYCDNGNSKNVSKPVGDLCMLYVCTVMNASIVAASEESREPTPVTRGKSTG